MSNIAEIERAVERLAPSELTAFRAWFVAYDADAWDREMQNWNLAMASQPLVPVLPLN